MYPKFDAADLLNWLEKAWAMELEDLDFGVIRMTREGAVTAYKRAEPLCPELELEPIRLEVDALDQQLDDVSLLAGEELFPVRIEPLQSLPRQSFRQSIDFGPGSPPRSPSRLQWTAGGPAAGR